MRDEAVSEVLGSVLLTATAVVLLGGFGVVVLATVDDTAVPPTGAFTLDAGLGDATVALAFLSGGSFAVDDARYVLLVDSADRLAAYRLDAPQAPGRFSPGDRLALDLAGEPLAEGERVRVLVVDKATGKSIGTASTTILGPGSLPAFVVSVPSLDAPTLSSSTLVADGSTLASLTMNVGATYGLNLVQRVSADLTALGGTMDVPMRDDGQGGDALAADGIYTLQLTASSHDFVAVPSTESVAIPVTVRDILGKTATTSVLITLQSPPESKAISGAIWRDLPPSDNVRHVNLTNFTFRDATRLDGDQLELRVSDLADPSVSWTALVTYAYAACSGTPSVTSITLTRDGVPGSLTYAPADGCFAIGPDAEVDLSSPGASLDQSGATELWTATGSESTFRYAAAGLGGVNEAIVTYLGDSGFPGLTNVGYGQADLTWMRGAPTSTTTPTAPGTPTATPGDRRVDLAWPAPASDGGGVLTSYRVYRGTTSGALTLLATIGTNRTFTDFEVQNGVTYHYAIVAVNALGEGPASGEESATPIAVPSAPQAFTATPGNATVALAWVAPASDGGFPILSYNVYRGTAPGSPALLANTGAANLTFVDDEAENGTTYDYRVAAVTSAGEGTATSTASATPTSLPNPPHTLVATAGDGKVTLTWVQGTDGGAALSNHRVYAGTTPGSLTLLASTGSGANTSFVVNGLANGQTYHFHVTAVNARGESAPSNPASAAPASGAAPPGPPQALAAAWGDGTVTLTWNAPATDGGSAITGYHVYQGASPTGTAWVAATDAGTLTYAATGLTNGQTYHFNVTAANALGQGATTPTVSATPLATPDPPTALLATPGDRSVTLAWTAPLDTGGAPITSYHVYAGTTSGGTTWLASTGGPNATFTVNGLTNGVAYFFNVTAVTAGGQSAGPNEVSAVPATRPNAPVLAATRGDGLVTLTWSAPANGGSPITNYKVYAGTTTATTFLALTGNGGNTSFVVNGLTNGQPYVFHLAAVNAQGESDASNQATATPAGLPGAPQALAAAKGDGSVTLTWSAPASNGGSPVTAYHVYRGTTSSTTYLTTLGATTTYTATGLANGQTYFFNVTAGNAVGQGPSSEQVSAVPSAVPGAPTSLQATRGNGTVSLQWTAPASNGGSALTAYHVYRGTSSGLATWLATVGPATTTYTATGLTNGVAYFFNVTAANANGQSASSNEASATPASAPNPPASLTATGGHAGGASVVNLTWTAPADNGGSAITAYQVWRGTTSGSLALLATTANGANTTFQDFAVAAGTTYHYHVRAVNALGASNPSVERSAVPTSAVGVPSAPLSLTATPANNQVALTWTTPASNGGSPLTGYKVYRGTASGTHALLATTANGANTTFTDRTALNNVTYYYVVRAVNAAGDGAASNEASAKPSSNVDINCSSLSLTAGSLPEGCTSLQFGGGMGNITETGAGGPNKEAIFDFTMNVTGITGTQTLELRGERGNAPENLLLQAYNPGTGAFVTIVTLPSTTTSQTTYSGAISMATYASNGVLTLRIRDAGPDTNNSSWVVDHVRLVTT